MNDVESNLTEDEIISHKDIQEHICDHAIDVGDITKKVNKNLFYLLPKKEQMIPTTIEGILRNRKFDVIWYQVLKGHENCDCVLPVAVFEVETGGGYRRLKLALEKLIYLPRTPISNIAAQHRKEYKLDKEAQIFPWALRFLIVSNERIKKEAEKMLSDFCIRKIRTKDNTEEVYSKHNIFILTNDEMCDFFNIMVTFFKR